jgi:hypothetical protein
MRNGWVVLLALGAFACERKQSATDAGPPVDAGFDAGFDAGWPRGEEPPLRFSNALVLDAGAAATSQLGVSVALTLDQHGQPLLAALAVDPSGDGNREDDRLVFTRWLGVPAADAGRGAFIEPVIIETVGAIDISDPNRQISLSRDDVTGRIGIAYVAQQGIRLGLSDDDGLNWSLETASATPGATVSNPQLVLHDGRTHLAYVEDQKIVYRTRAGKALFQDQAVPLVGDATSHLALPLSMALDDAGNVGLAYFVGAPGTRLAFWRPGTTTANQIADAALVDNAAPAKKPSVTLTFLGALPRAAYHLLTSTDVTAAQLWFSAATDAAGATWGTPVGIPRYGATAAPEGTHWYQGLAVDADRVFIGAFFALTPSTPLQQCRGPRTSVSTNGTAFTTCSPDMATFGFAGQWMNVARHGAKKATMAFFYDPRANPFIKSGVVLWREP